MKSLLNILESREMIKAIMISDKPRYCAKIMNGEKTIEVRRNKALVSAIQKLIGENGYADIYVYCSKDKSDKETLKFMRGRYGCMKNYDPYDKVIFKFRCYKVEEISWQMGVYQLEQQGFNDFLDKCCLGFCEIKNYLNRKNGYAIHISDLEIFDKPKELCEFESTKQHLVDVGQIQPILQNIRLTKAPKNFCYIEVEDND